MAACAARRNFPNAALFELLWRAGERAPAEQSQTRTAAPAFFGRVLLTLEHISEGGIYDHLGGGFSRYSVDERWLVPHFEKMLDDNAQLLELLAIAHARPAHPRERAARDGRVAGARDDDTRKARFRPRSMPIWRGRRASSMSGRSAEVMDVLGPEDGAYFAAQYDVTPEGNFEGHNILN